MSADLQLAGGARDDRPSPHGRLASQAERARLLERLWDVIDGAPGGALDDRPAGVAR